MDGHVRNVLIGRIPLCYPVKKGHFFGNNMLFVDMFSQEDEIRKAVAEQVHILTPSYRTWTCMVRQKARQPESRQPTVCSGQPLV